MLSFSPTIDLSLLGITLLAFLINFQLWPNQVPKEHRETLQSRKFTASMRVLFLFVVATSLFWLLNVPVWPFYAVALLIAISGSIFVADDFAAGLVLAFTAGMIREWCFGFPNLVLNPPPDVETHAVDSDAIELIGAYGLTTGTLRPSGNIEINQQTFPATTDDGTMLEGGRDVIVVGQKNGLLQVQAATPPHTDGS